MHHVICPNRSTVAKVNIKFSAVLKCKAAGIAVKVWSSVAALSP
jgi:hypothetical protein